MRAFDTNILAYAAGLRRVSADEPKIARAIFLVREQVREEKFVLPAQVLAELHHLLRKKGSLSSREASEVIDDYAYDALIVPTGSDVLAAAFALAADHRLQTYDAIILAAAAKAECEVLYSEDMQDGFVWNGVTVINPFGQGSMTLQPSARSEEP